MLSETFHFCHLSQQQWLYRAVVVIKLAAISLHNLMNTDQHFDSVDIFGSLSLYYIIWLQPVIDSQGCLVLPEPMPQQMTVYHFSITPKIYFFFDRVGYSSLQNSATILREHMKKKKGELIENTGKIIHGRVESVTAIPQQYLYCKLLCMRQFKIWFVYSMFFWIFL